MNSQMLDSLDELTLEELETFSLELKEFIKAKRQEAKLKAETAFKETVEIGEEVIFMFKSESQTGKVVKVNEKSFTAEFIYNGSKVKKPIQFHLFAFKAKDAPIPMEEAV